MPRYYGIFLDVKNRTTIVFGGDHHEAQRKVEYLLECEAKVRVFCPDSQLSDRLRELVTLGKIEWISRRYKKGDLKGAWLAIVADTTDKKINHAISEEAKEHNVLLNVMDVTPLCTFIAPSLVHRNEVTVAISTSGTSPALARRLREEMSDKECRCLRWSNVSSLLANTRKEVRSRGLVFCPEQWQNFMTHEWLRSVESCDEKKVISELIKNFESVNCKSCSPYGTCKRIEVPEPMKMDNSGH